MGPTNILPNPFLLYLQIHILENMKHYMQINWALKGTLTA